MDMILAFCIIFGMALIAAICEIVYEFFHIADRFDSDERSERDRKRKD